MFPDKFGKIYAGWHGIEGVLKEELLDLTAQTEEEISKCDALLIDFDWPASGRMVELWIAFAMKKKIILIAKKDIFVKETIVGVTDSVIQYNELEDIIEPMSKLLESRENIWK